MESVAPSSVPVGDAVGVSADGSVRNGTSGPAVDTESSSVLVSSVLSPVLVVMAGWVVESDGDSVIIGDSVVIGDSEVVGNSVVCTVIGTSEVVEDSEAIGVVEDSLV